MSNLEALKQRIKKMQGTLKKCAPSEAISSLQSDANVCAGLIILIEDEWKS